jgi:uncharacterized protein (AIM24 family)
MHVSIQANPAFAFGTITIDPGGEVQVEAGAMAAYSDGVDIETKARGGMLAGLRRSVLGGETFFINTFRAAGGGTVNVDTKWGGGKTFFSGKGLFLLRCTGQGDVLVAAYGAILSMTLDAGQGYTLDTGHVVAFDESVEFSVHKAGNWKTTVLGGEGLVTRFTGPGRLWLQTRSQNDLIN